MRGSNYKAMTGKILGFGYTVAYGRLLLTRGYCTWRFDFILRQLWFAIILSVQLLQTVDKFYVKNPRVLDITGMYDYF